MRDAETRFAVATLAAIVCGVGAIQGLKRDARANAPAALALQTADYAAMPIAATHVRQWTALGKRSGRTGYAIRIV